MATGLLFSSMNQPSIDAYNHYPVVGKSQSGLRFSLSEEKQPPKCKFAKSVSNLIEMLYSSSYACCVLQLVSLTLPWQKVCIASL
jgi:hypothetical protein